MGSRMGRRVVHFANLPIKLLMPSSFSNITEIALKTIPSATKIEKKSMYGFEVEEVRTLNMDGKKIKRRGIVLAKSDYKKAYVTLRNPLSVSPETYPIKIIQEEKQKLIDNAKKKSTTVEDVQPKTPHWLDDKKNVVTRRERWSSHRHVSVHKRDRTRPRVNDRDRASGETAKFPWSNMRSFAR